jgi:Lon protease-like protein
VTSEDVAAEPGGPVELPMFPLGSVLVPGMVLPLHVFEPRYQALVEHCLAGTPEFGVVLIERGSEVGGGDLRRDVGAVARIVEAARFDDGRWALGCVGVRRIRVERWLPDDPYPRAEVLDWPDEAASPEAPAAARRVTTALRQVLALAAELGVPAAPATTELSDDPGIASHQATALAPLGPVDTHALLCEPGVDARLARLEALLAEEVEFLSARLALASEPLDPDDEP